MLTNFATVRKSVNKMTSMDRMATDGTFDNISKKERLQISRQKAKMEKLIGSIADLTRLPAALFIVDIKKEHIAISEAQKLNIPTFAITDTNTDPSQVDFAIPGNDDATKSVSILLSVVCKAIEEGLAERKLDKETEREKEASAEKEDDEFSDKRKRLADEEEEGSERNKKEKVKTAAPGARTRKPTASKR